MFLLVILLLFISSLQRPEVQSFTPSVDYVRVETGTVVHDTVTLDARDGSSWAYFDLEGGVLVDGTVNPDWDVAVQRFHFVTNGGLGYPGEGAAAVVEAPFESVADAPAGGFEQTEGAIGDAPANPVLERWYTYSFFAHTLVPNPETYVIRTRNGRFAKLAIISYYCPEATPGCFTFEYAYQQNGSGRLTP